MDPLQCALVVLSAAGRDHTVIDDPVAHAHTLVGDGVADVAEALVEPWLSTGGHILWPGDPARPRGLGSLGAAEPLLLWVRGSLPVDGAVSIVGSRQCTSYGRDVALALARAAVTEARVVVSGGAVGIDAAAHHGALDAGGRTIVYLAGGAGRVYPPEHRDLLRAAASNGAVAWEFPSNAPLRKESFLVRNRLIAATGDVTVLVEAAQRSGALNTGRTSADLGRLVLAVPGQISSPGSGGTNRAIADGWAAILLDVPDFCQLLPTAGV